MLEAFGQDRGQPGLDGRLGVDQPLKVLAGQLEEPAGFGAPDGGKPGVAVAASPVAGGELTEMVTGAGGPDRAGVDEDLVPTGQDDIEGPVGVPSPDDLLPAGGVEMDAAGPDGLDRRVGRSGIAGARGGRDAGGGLRGR